jgi:hypothetical protein
LLTIFFRIPLGDESLHKLRVDSLKKLLEQGKVDTPIVFFFSSPFLAVIPH